MRPSTLVLLLVLIGWSFGARAASNVFSSDVQMCSGRPWVDIMCNGADPTGVADSTAAINATFNAAITNGWTVLFPPGTFKVTSKISVNFQGQAANGLNIISNGAIIDGRTVVTGNVIQFYCSGGTTLNPAVCNGLQIAGQLTVLGNTSAYVVVIGQTDFSDKINGARIEHLVVTNTSAGGAIQANYLANGNLWLSGSTAGGSSSVGAVVLEQVQTSKIAGWGSAAGASAPALLIENGASVGNSFEGFAYDQNTNTCVSVPSATAMRNTWVSPYFPCTTAVSAPNGPNQNALLGPSFAGTNMGPTSGGYAVVGRGSLSRFSAPTTASLTLAGADDGTIVSSANGLGPLTQFAAASLPVTLPNPSAVGAGWTAGFVTDSGKAVVITAPVGKMMVANKQYSTLTVGAAGATGFESAVLQSDGSNFRVVHLSQGSALLNGAQAAFPAAWVHPGGAGYQATQADNGDVISDDQTTSGLAVTLPSTTGLLPGWMVGISSTAGKTTTVQSSASAGSILSGSGGAMYTAAAVPVASGSIMWVQFDGDGMFRPVAPCTVAPCAANMGSVSAPDNTQNPAMSVIKYTTGLASGSQTNPGISVKSTKTASTPGYRTEGLLSEGIDTAGGNGTFVEGLRATGTLTSTSVSGQADGVVCVGQVTPATAFNFLIGCEADVENEGFNAGVFNSNHFAVGFLATNAQNAASFISDAGFMVNPFNAKPYRVGFYVPGLSLGTGGGASDAAFRSDGATAYGLDLTNASNSFAAIEIPNNTPFRIKGQPGGPGIGSSTGDLNVMYIPPGSNSFILGLDTQGVTLPPVSAPAAPGTGYSDMYSDVSDGLFKILDSGTMVKMPVGYGTPVSSSSTCTKGQVEFDTTYIYTCVAANTWHRVSNGSTW